MEDPRRAEHVVSSVEEQEQEEYDYLADSESGSINEESLCSYVEEEPQSAQWSAEVEAEIDQQAENEEQERQEKEESPSNSSSISSFKEVNSSDNPQYMYGFGNGIIQPPGQFLNGNGFIGHPFGQPLPYYNVGNQSGMFASQSSSTSSVRYGSDGGYPSVPSFNAFGQTLPSIYENYAPQIQPFNPYNVTQEIGVPVIYKYEAPPPTPLPPFIVSNFHPGPGVFEQTPQPSYQYCILPENGRLCANETEQWAEEVEAEFGKHSESYADPARSLISSFQEMNISDRPQQQQYHYQLVNGISPPAPGMVLNGVVGYPVNQPLPYYNQYSGSASFHSPNSSILSSPSGSSVSLGSDGSYASVSSFGPNIPIVYRQAPSVTQLVTQRETLKLVGMTYYENGAELPFVSSIWTDNHASLFKRSSQKYEYYVPPRVDDNDYFGGQIRIWAMKFGEHFSKFPHVWRLQALPEIPQPLPRRDEPTPPLPDWFLDSMTTKLRFCCRQCKRPWTSMRGKVGFLFTLSPLSGRGHVFLKVFSQVCNQEPCVSQGFQPPACYPEEVEKVVWKLSQFIGNLFYQIPYSQDLYKTSDKAIRDGHPKSQHLQELWHVNKECAQSQKILANESQEDEVDVETPTP